jgi:stage II sporulation protein R
MDSENNLSRTEKWMVIVMRFTNIRKTVLILILIAVICIVYGVSTQKKIADSVVRLHIIGSSDSAGDQTLKLKVRDAILEHMKARYPNGATREEAARYLKSSLPEIETIASGVLRENGSDNAVNVQYGVFSFPTKEYGNISLPAGMYEAVRVELGEAKGKNWWCVMFPPLCVADANSLRIDADAMNELREELGPDNYSLITDMADRKNVPVKIKFRIVELVESSRIKFAELINHMF